MLTAPVPAAREAAAAVAAGSKGAMLGCGAACPGASTWLEASRTAPGWPAALEDPNACCNFRSFSSSAAACAGAACSRSSAVSIHTQIPTKQATL